MPVDRNFSDCLLLDFVSDLLVGAFYAFVVLEVVSSMSDAWWVWLPAVR